MLQWKLPTWWDFCTITSTSCYPINKTDEIKLLIGENVHVGLYRSCPVWGTEPKGKPEARWHLPRAILSWTGLEKALECPPLPLHLETDTYATSTSTIATAGVCSHCWARLGRAVCHYKKQEPVTFTEYTGYTGGAREGGEGQVEVSCLSL